MAKIKIKKVKLVPLATLIVLGIVLVASLLSKSKVVTPKDVEGDVEVASVNIFLIALEDGGVNGKEVGCGDSAISIPVQIVPTKGVVKKAIDELILFNPENVDGELYNSLYKSGLRLDSVSIQSGVVTVEFNGRYGFTGVCEDARLISQIEETVLQFPSVEKVEIFINGRDLKNLYKGN